MTPGGPSGRAPRPHGESPLPRAAVAEDGADAGALTPPNDGEDGRPRGCFRRAQRVRKRSEFLEIQAAGRRVATPRLVLLLRAREGAATGARLGITVSRKVGVAVTRNRARRVVREAFRAPRSLWPPDCDVVVVVRRAAPAPGLAAVIAALRQAERAIRRRAAAARRDREARRENLARGA